MEVLNPTDHSWVGSEVGLVLKTTTVASSTVSAGADGRKVMKAGSLISDTKLGKVLLWNDIDVTEGDRIVSVMYAGYYIDSKLPASVAASKADLAGHGLFAIVL